MSFTDKQYNDETFTCEYCCGTYDAVFKADDSTLCISCETDIYHMNLDSENFDDDEIETERFHSASFLNSIK